MTRDADLNFSDLITLDDACKHFLGGKVTVATLRALHKDEKLEIYRIGRRDFTTNRGDETMPEITHPSFSDLSEDEKATVIELILKHFGRRIEAYKFDGSSHREMSLVYLDPHEHC